MNEEQPTEQPSPESARNDQQTPEPAPDEQQPPAPVRSDPQLPDPRRRLRELLAIPDHQRTDALWDEIIELEICLAPGNRVQGTGAQPEPGRRQGPGQGQNQGRRPEQARRPDAATPGSKPAKRFFKKSKRPPGGPPKP